MAAGGRPVIVMLVLLGLLHNAAAETYLVGQESSTGDSWTYVTGSQTSYDDQFSNINLVVGDVLRFVFTASHDVSEVPPADVASCDSSNQISSYTSSVNITLASAGQHGFICTIPGHCSSDGMFLTVTVNDAAAPGTSPSSAPVTSPSPAPVPSPSTAPVTSPSSAPVTSPSSAPVTSPSSAPVTSPSSAPVTSPSSAPVTSPSSAPVTSPSSAPVTSPSSAPETSPSSAPETSPPAGPASPPQDSASFQLKSLPAVILGSLVAACAVLAL